MSLFLLRGQFNVFCEQRRDITGSLVSVGLTKDLLAIVIKYHVFTVSSNLLANVNEVVWALSESDQRFIKFQEEEEEDEERSRCSFMGIGSRLTQGPGNPS